MLLNGLRNVLIGNAGKVVVGSGRSTSLQVLARRLIGVEGSEDVDGAWTTSEAVSFGATRFGLARGGWSSSVQSVMEWCHQDDDTDRKG